MGADPCELFKELMPEMADDWQCRDMLQHPDGERILFKQYKNSRSLEVAGEEMSPGRFISDHYKMKETLPMWTERAAQWHIMLCMNGKLEGKGKLWDKWKEQRLREDVAKEAAAIADGAAPVAPKLFTKIAGSTALPVRNNFCACMQVCV